MNKKKCVVYTLLLLLIKIGSAGAVSELIDTESSFVTDGDVKATAYDATRHRLYFGGSFNNVWPLKGGAIPFSSLSGELLTYPKFMGDVYAFAPDGSGGWYVGGHFSQVSDSRRSNIVHILSDYTVDPAWAPVIEGNNPIVRSIVVQSGLVYVGGDFNLVNGVTRNSLAALNIASGEVSVWNPDLRGSSRVNSLAVSGGVVYVGGIFTGVGSDPVTNMAAISSTSGRALSGWNAGVDGRVNKIILKSDSILIAGGFRTVDRTPQPYLAAINYSDGRIISSFRPTIDFDVYTMAYRASTNVLYIGGGFLNVNGTARYRQAALNATTGALVTSWNPPGPTTGSPGCMALNSSALFITGNFVGFTGVGTRKYLAALNLDTGAVLDWSPNLNSFGASCFADDSIVYIGGGFTSLGDSSPRSRLASIDTNSDSLTSWAPSFDGSINDIKLTSNTMFLAGAFQNVGGQGRGRLASINLDTQALNSWSPNADGEVYTLTASNDAVRVGGNFRNIAGVSQSFYSELNPLSAALQGANPQPDGPVYSILDRDGDVYLGGTFRSLGVTPRTYVGNFAVDGVLGSFNPVITEGSENGVHAMITGPQLFYMAGAFSTVGGQRRRNLASFNRDFSIVSWLPPTSTSNLLTLKANGPEVFVGGEGSWPLPALFSIVEDAGTPSLSRWAPSFLGSRVNALSVGNNLYVGGDRGLFVYHEICGNGSREGSETCDDGNTNALDGCSAFCLNEGVGIALPSGTNVTISQGAVGHLSVVSSRTNISDSVPINLSVQTISPTADITIDPLVVPSSSPVDMNIHVGATVPTGDYTVIIQGQAGSLTNINGFTVTVTNSIGTGGSATGGTSGDAGSGGSGTGGSSGSGGTTDGSGGDTGLPGGGVSGISGGSGSDGTGGASGASGTGVTPGEGAGASSSGGCSCHVTPEMY